MNKPKSNTINFHGLSLSLEDLYCHVCITGRPGSGKSRGCVAPLVKQLLGLNSQDPSLKAGLFAIDGKGSELRGYIESALRAAGREKDLVVIGPKDSIFNPLGDPTWDDVKIANELIHAASFLGGERFQSPKASDPFWDRAMRDVLTALVAVAKHTLIAESRNAGASAPDVLTIDHLVRLRPFLTKPDREILKMAQEMATLLEEDIGASLIEYASLPPVTRQSVASSVGPNLAPFGRSPLRDVLIPHEGRAEADLRTIISEGKVVLLDVGEAENSIELLPAAVLAKACFARMVLSRKRKAANQTRPVFALFEELQKVLTPQTSSPACEANWMDTCRWCRCGVVLSTQGISSLLAVAAQPLVETIISLCATQMWLGSSDPSSGTYAARCFGTKTTYQAHRTPSRSLPPPLLFPRDDESDFNDTRVLVPVSLPVLSPEKLARTPPGTIHLRMRDGSTHTVKADLSAQ